MIEQRAHEEREEKSYLQKTPVLCQFYDSDAHNSHACEKAHSQKELDKIK
jgi:hypothetical protein